jgi:murein DD-endopeptidase MepM/ murein hydrolase activator NlpD
MPRLKGPILRAAAAVSAAILVCTAGASSGSRSTIAEAASTSTLQHRIGVGQQQISTLSGLVSGASARLNQLDPKIAAVEHQLGGVQSDLYVERAQLLRLRAQLDLATARLTELEAAQTRAEHALASQLISSYESDRPDLVTVVLESTGFQDLLERIGFLERVGKQDVQEVAHVRAARRAVAEQATRLGALERRQQELATSILAQRNKLAKIRTSLLQQRLSIAQTRRRHSNELARVQAQVAALQGQLSSLGAAPSSSSAQEVATTRLGSGFVFPLPKNAASPPETWSPDDGVDISAAANTPEYAVCSGTIVLHGIGGFGPWAPVLHCDNALGGYSYVYYGHAGPANQLPVGARVSAGQVMSSIGPGIVGISTGPHLEIGFADSSGGPIGPQSASTMLALLHRAYGG